MLCDHVCARRMLIDLGKCAIERPTSLHYLIVVWQGVVAEVILDDGTFARFNNRPIYSKQFKLVLEDYEVLAFR